ncbi:amino acid permease [Acidianus infernus]|uniref:Amino acid permease n=1 Tax=Acidianus infernus TaxID=12915 RepID=A0A6A9QI52_ACIIN|nr:amino acid permease [Acidianus infernus]MUM64920.1 amino acid permease [Acidianus infernus]
MSKGLFIRESSGLVRQMDARHSFSKVFVFINPLSVYYTLLYAPALPSASWSIGIILPVILALPVFLVYLFLSEYVPRSSGEYIYISRILGPIPASIQAYATIIFNVLIAAIASQLEVTAGISPALQIIGLSLHDSSLFNLGTSLSTTYFFPLTTALIVIFWLISLLSPKYFSTYIYVVAIMDTLGSILISYLLLSSGIEVYSNVFNHFSSLFSGPTYQSLYSQGLNYYSTNISPLQTLVFSVLMLMWVYVWFFGPSYFAGEYKQATRTLKLGMISGYLIASVITILLVLGVSYTISIPFFNFVALQGWGNIPISPSEGFLAWTGILTLPHPFFAIITMALSASIFMAIPLNFALPSRVILAMAFDRLLPEKLAYVSPRLKTPIIASAVLLPISIFFNYATIYLNLSVSLIGLVILIFIYQFLLATISAAIAGFKGIKGVSLTSNEKLKLMISGFLASIILGLSIVVTLWYGYINSLFGSMVFAGNELGTLILIAIDPLLGILTYILAKWYRNRQGIDVNLVFNEIPPD